MSNFFNTYFNPLQIASEKREYKQQMARVRALPDDYQYVFKKIQQHMWKFATGNGYDMMKIQYGLIDTFEKAATDGKEVLSVTGPDVVAFCDELLRNAKTYTEKWRSELNSDIASHFNL